MKRISLFILILLLFNIYNFGAAKDVIFRILRPDKSPNQSQVHIKYPFSAYNKEDVYVQKTKNGNIQALSRRFLVFPLNDWISDPWQDEFCYEFFLLEDNTIKNSKKFCSGFGK